LDRGGLGFKPRSPRSAPAQRVDAAVGMTPRRTNLKVGNYKREDR
jgi:hypothetical protein